MDVDLNNVYGWLSANGYVDLTFYQFYFISFLLPKKENILLEDEYLHCNNKKDEYLHCNN